jgi:hypothetical protein
MEVYTSPWPKRRIGSEYDGGYVICDLPGSYDRFISGGICNDNNFECALLDMYPDLICDAFDNSIDSVPNSHPRINFYRTYLGDTEDLSSYVHGYSNVFMKIDIEGHELKLLPIMIKNGTIKNIKQLVVEFHSPVEYHIFANHYVNLDGITVGDLTDTMNSLCKTHRLVHLHANNGCAVTNKIPNVFECTYIRTDETLPLSADVIPSSIDRPNCPELPEIVLDYPPFCFSK